MSGPENWSVVQQAVWPLLLLFRDCVLAGKDDRWPSVASSVLRIGQRV